MTFVWQPLNLLLVVSQGRGGGGGDAACFRQPLSFFES